MSSADPDLTLLRGSLVPEEASAQPAPQAVRGRRAFEPRERGRYDEMSRLVRVVVPAASMAAAAALVGLDRPWEWGAAALTGTVVLAKTAVSPQLDVASELTYVRRATAVLSVVLLALVLPGVVALPLARSFSATALAGIVSLTACSLLLGLKVPPRRILLVGDRKAAQDLIRQWDLHPSVQVCGVCLDDRSLEESAAAVEESAVMGAVSEVPILVERHNIDQVVVAPGPRISAYDVRRLTWGLEQSRAGLAVAAEVHGATPRRVAPELIGRRLVLTVSTPRPTVVHRVVKAAVDRAVGLSLLLFFAPVLIGLAVAVRLDSRGPAIFRQTRTGIGGQAFTMFKFRTMRVGAEHMVDDLRDMNVGAGPLFKVPDDPRMTRLGRRLRRSSLDELPQLLNVVRGDMSLIGPRPGLPSETREYDEWIARRLRVKPGMTGLWQVSGRSKLGWHESVRLDLDYVDNQTLRDELAIAYKTVRAVLQRDGAM